MTLITPLVRGPLTEWTASFLVEGCLPGAQIVVSSVGTSPRTLGKSTAVGGSDRVSLLPGEALQAQDRIVVFQTLGSESSVSTPSHFAVPVAPAPTLHAALPPLSFLTYVYPCGRAIWVSGAVPGAQVLIVVAILKTVRRATLYCYVQTVLCRNAVVWRSLHSRR